MFDISDLVKAIPHVFNDFRHFPIPGEFLSISLYLVGFIKICSDTTPSIIIISSLHLLELLLIDIIYSILIDIIFIMYFEEIKFLLEFLSFSKWWSAPHPHPCHRLSAHHTQGLSTNVAPSERCVTACLATRALN